MSYYNSSICLNGHVMSAKNSDCQKFCSICGSKVISKCPSCGSPIHGTVQVQPTIVIAAHYTPDFYCYNCGKPYPWTEKIINSAVEILSLDEELSDETKDLLKNSIPDLIVETPKTTVAIARYKQYLDKAKPLIKNAFYQLLTSVLSEAFLSSLFPQQPQ